MRRERSSRGLSMVLGTVLAVTGTIPAGASVFDPSQIVFPVIGEVSFTDTFDAARSGGRTHNATDILGEKMLPVVAAADGVVAWISSECCLLSIDHGDGWQTWYIHLNNDTPGTDDGAAWGIAPGIARGASVRSGELIGWVGDSGNAEWVGSHLHFEIRQNGVPVNPYPYLLAAPRLISPIAYSYSGQFRDDDGSPHEADIDRLYSEGITRGCSEAGDLYCPDDQITRGQMAAFIRRLLGLAPSGADFFSDDSGNLFEDDINAITGAGIGFGCSIDSYCPDAPLRRDEMAELLVRTFGFQPVADDYFVDDLGSAFQPSINALKAAGITYGCSPDDPTLYCPDRLLTRAEMASFFIRSLDA